MLLTVMLTSVMALPFAIPAALWPYKVARLEERLNAIGSKPAWSDVEPAKWKISMTKIFGVGFTVLGILSVSGLVVWFSG